MLEKSTNMDTLFPLIVNSIPFLFARIFPILLNLN